MWNRKVRRNFNLILGFVIILGFVFLIIFSKFYGNKSTNFLVDPSSKNPAKNSNNLENVVKNALQGTNGTYSVAIKNLKTNETYFLNEHKSYKAGSLYKLWIMAVAFKQIQDGILDETESLSDDIAELNKKFNIDEEGAELTEGEINFSVASALRQMITISHNYAALLLTEKVKLSKVREFIKEHNFNETIIGKDLPTTTAFDTALFLEKLYKGELGGIENTQKMLGFLKEQTLNNKLPKYLPSEIVVAHKTGEIDFLTHDAGIIYSSRGDYIIVVMSESSFPADTEDVIAKISKSVFEYFTKN